MRKGGRGMNAKLYAEELYNKYYAIIFEYGEELSQEVVVSQLAKKCAIQAVNDTIESFKLIGKVTYITGMIEYLDLQQIIKELEQL